MYKHCSTEESAHRQRQFEQCLLDLMMEHSYEQITVSMICEKIGLSRKSFYRYFSSKDGCLHGLVDRSIMEFMAYYIPSEDSNQQLAIYEDYFCYWQTLSPLLEVLYRNQLSACLFERILRCTTQENHELRKLLKNSLNDDLYDQVLFVISGLTGLLINWHVTGYQKSPRRMAMTLERLLKMHI